MIRDEPTLGMFQHTGQRADVGHTSHSTFYLLNSLINEITMHVILQEGVADDTQGCQLGKLTGDMSGFEPAVTLRPKAKTLSVWPTPYD